MGGVNLWRMSIHSIDQLDAYLVGGAVRDELLGRAVHDRDWVVVGATVKEMKRLGFKQVGRDFPVFLHPQNHDEYALARTERKSGQGHTGFVVHADADVTLEQDLERRDFTMNAIAKRTSGEYEDPFDGRRDIEACTIRHVSDAFAEDPLRVFRGARFAAELGFEVADETYALMKVMTNRGDLKTLSAERVWAELLKALAADQTSRFFTVLAKCGGMRDWFPELASSGSLSSLDAKGAERTFVRLVADLGDEEFASLCQRIKIPRRFRQLAGDCRAFAGILARWQAGPAEELLDALLSMKVAHNLERLSAVLDVLEVEEEEALLSLAQSLSEISLPPDTPQGPEYGQALQAARMEKVSQSLAAHARSSG